MAFQQTTVKRLYGKSANRCAFAGCEAPIIVGKTVVGEICHIRASRKKGPRFDPTLSKEERDDFSNLLLLCRTHHKLIDADPSKFTVDLLKEIKQIHEKAGPCEITPEVARDALLLLVPKSNRSRSRAAESGSGIAIAVGRDLNGSVTINHSPKVTKSHYPENSIGADANLCGYVDYLFGLAIEYWKGVEAMNPGRLGRKIKLAFMPRSSKTRNHLSVDRFNRLVEYIIQDLILPSPVGKKHVRNGTKAYSTFEEWLQSSS